MVSYTPLALQQIRVVQGMHRLTNKQVILGITGGIAAYKSAELTRHLKAAGADVRVVMTPAATEFITPNITGPVWKSGSHTTTRPGSGSRHGAYRVSTLG